MIKLLLTVLLLTSAVIAQVTLKRGAVVYCGSPSNTTAPATIDESLVREATLEWQTVESEGIDVNSARGKQLIRKMNVRIREAIKNVASEEGVDLVVRDKDITDAQGKSIKDISREVIDTIEK